MITIFISVFFHSFFRLQNSRFFTNGFRCLPHRRYEEKNVISVILRLEYIVILALTTCYIVAEWYITSWMVSVISTEEPKDTIPPDSDQFINNLAFQAVVLPFIWGIDTYTILNPSVAPWFFTDNLGGCDVFVSTAANRGSSPMVIHSNRGKFIKDLARDLLSKGEDVDKILKRKSESDGYEWKVIARVY